MRAAPIIIASGNGAKALPAGVRILKRGGSALDAVEACARYVEADVTDVTVGRGGLPNILGVVELDASIVDGTTHRAGAVAALVGFHHPITIARAVMTKLPHVMLVGEGAAMFAGEIGAERIENLTPSTRKLWVEALKMVGETPASVRRTKRLLPIVKRVIAKRLGTVNFIALDKKGNVASAVTTSGWGYKYPGRVGDSPIIGAGNYCDTSAGGACCTGFGELAMRNVTADTRRRSRAVSTGAVVAWRNCVRELGGRHAPSHAAAMRVVSDKPGELVLYRGPGYPMRRRNAELRAVEGFRHQPLVRHL